MDPRLSQAAKLTFVGTCFAGIWAVLNLFFANNPITHNGTMARFLAVNAMETVLIAGLMISFGTVLKIFGVKSHQLEVLLDRGQNRASHGL